MAKKDAGKLRDKAAEASAKGRHKKALEIYMELEALEPNDGGWSRRVGEQCRQLDDSEAAIAAYGRACKRYASQGFLVKAVATCKIILRIDPDHLQAQEQLAAFNVERGLFIQSPDAEDKPQQKQVQVQVPPPVVQDVHAPIETMSFHEQVQGATQRVVGAIPSGVFEIPLELDIDMGIDVEVEEPDDEAKLEALEQTPLFSALSPASLQRLIDKVELIELPAGQFLFQQGNPGTALYVVAEGRVSVLTEGPPQAVIGELKDGDFFGEVAVVTDQPRNASVQALTDSELLCVERACLRELIAEEPAVLPVLLRFLRERLINNLMVNSPLFAPFQGPERQRLISRFKFLEVDSGTVLVKQGDVSAGLFVTMSGRFSVDRSEQGKTLHLADLKSGDVFGEMSLLANTGAVATVTATSKCLVLELPAKPFREVIMTHPHVLAFIGDLASEREAALARVAGGEQQYEDLHLDLF